MGSRTRQKMNEEDLEELQEQLQSLAEYYSEATGRNVEMGVNLDEEIWIDTMRTNGREFYESVDDAEYRVKQLYAELFVDDLSDPMEGI
jgi:hypothetical protein